MSKNKIIPLLALFLVLFMVAGAVSAANDDIAVSDANDNGNETLKVSHEVGTNETTLNTNLENKNVENNGVAVNNGDSNPASSGTYAELNSEISAAQEGSTINLDKDYTYSASDSSYIWYNY